MLVPVAFAKDVQKESAAADGDCGLRLRQEARKDAAGRKVAVVVNGDAEPRHLENVRQSVGVLQRQGYDVHVLNRERPDGIPADRFFPPTQAGLKALRERLEGQGGQDTDLVIYTTGHGDLQEGGGALCLADGCDAEGVSGALDAIRYGKRTVIMDQCYSGNWGKRFLNDPKTLFISGGSESETTCCQEIAPRFWSDEVPDANRDGVISWQERYAHTVTDRELSSTPQYLPSAGYRLEGRAPFRGAVVEVADEAELAANLRALKAGQYAIITFSAEWCGPCKEYRPEFDRMAAEGGGQHLWLRTENGELAAAWGVEAFPTVVIVDATGRRLVLEPEDRLEVARVLSESALSPEERMMAEANAARNIADATIRHLRLDAISEEADRLGYEKARRIVREQALVAAWRIEDPVERASALFMNYVWFSKHGEDEKAGEILRRLLGEEELLPVSRRAVVPLIAFALKADESSDREKAFRRAIAVARMVKVEEGRYQALGQVGLALRKADRESEALTMFREAVASAMLLPEEPRVFALLEIAANMRNEGLMGECLPVVERASASVEGIAEPHGRAMALGEIGSYMRMYGRGEEAEAFFERAIASAERIHNVEFRIGALNEIAHRIHQLDM